MRIDKFLKVSRLIKRRTVAGEACTRGLVLINGKQAKPASTLKEGDTIEINMGKAPIKCRVIRLTEHALKEDASSMYELVE